MSKEKQMPTQETVIFQNHVGSLQFDTLLLKYTPFSVMSMLGFKSSPIRIYVNSKYIYVILNETKFHLYKIDQIVKEGSDYYISMFFGTVNRYEVIISLTKKANHSVLRYHDILNIFGGAEFYLDDTQSDAYLEVFDKLYEEHTHNEMTDISILVLKNVAERLKTIWGVGGGAPSAPMVATVYDGGDTSSTYSKFVGDGADALSSFSHN